MQMHHLCGSREAEVVSGGDDKLESRGSEFLKLS